VAGNGLIGSTGDGGPATVAKVSPYSICIDKHNNLCIAEWGTGLGTIRKIDTNGIITTIAGDTSGYLYNGDTQPATNATLDPAYIVFDESGQLYISDFYNDRVRMIDTFGIIHTIVGNGVGSYTGDGGPADSAEIHSPSGLVFDACGNIFIGQVATPRIRKITFNPTCDPYSHGTTDSSSLSVNAITTNNITIYPNPATTSLTITASNKITQIIISNLIGQVVYSQSYAIEKAEVNISGLPEGMYIVKVTDSEGRVMVTKIIKQ
jgi:hypothetical protein